MKRILLTISFILTCMLVYSQNIKGTLVSQDNKQAVPAASVLLYNNSGKLVKEAFTNDKGEFNIDAKGFEGSHKLKISFLGYKTIERTVKLGDKDINFPNLNFVADFEMLEAAEVTGIVQRVTIKGDTTELNADAYKVNPDASAQDLVTKMPGIIVQDGKVQAQGEDVTKVLVDGKEYFGTDVNTALSSLPAELIDKIQIFDEQSDQAKFTGFKDGNTSKALNILTKNKLNRNTVGKFKAGYGTDDKYGVGINFNEIYNERRIALTAQSNNINQNFATEDESSGGRGRRGGSGVGGSGITKTNSLGVNYSNTFRNKLKLTASATYNRGDRTNDELTLREYIAENNLGQIYNEKSRSNNINNNYSFNGRLEYEINKNNTLLITPRVTFSDGNSKSNLLSDMLDGVDSINRTTNRYTSTSQSINFSNNILFRHKFKKEGRTLTLGLGTSYNNNDGDNQQYSTYRYYQSGLDSIMNQESNTDRTGWSLSPTIALTEALSKKSMLMLNYKMNYQFNDSEKKSYEIDSISGGMDFLPKLSNIFESRYTTHSGGLSYMFNSEKVQLNTALNYQNASLDNLQSFPTEGKVKQSFNSILPSARFMYRFTKQKSLMFNYRTSANSPSISQLQEVLDNSNITMQRTGNPNLKENYTHNMFARYGSTKTNGTSLSWMIGGGLSESYIGNRTIIAEQDTIVNVGGNDFFLGKNGQLISPDNMSGYLSLHSFLTYGLPLQFIKSNLNINANVRYTRTPEILNDVKYTTSKPTFGAGFTLSSNISQNLDFTISSTGFYNMERSSRSNKQNNDYFNLRNNFKVTWIVFNHLVLQTDAQQNIYTGLSTSQNYFLWNASVGYKFLKKNAAEVKLSVFDILKQNKSYSRNTTTLYTEDISNNTLTRYAMITFTYNLRKFSGKNDANATTTSGDRERMYREGGGGGRPMGGGGHGGGRPSGF